MPEALPRHFMVRVVAPGFVAAVVIKDGFCVQAAPILARHCKGRRAAQVSAYFQRMRWRATIIETITDEDD